MPRLRFEHLLTPAGFTPAEVTIDDKGRIAAVEAVSRGPWDGWLALPGMVNAHSHSFQRAMCGYAERATGERSFWGWRELMYRIAQAVTPDDQHVIALQAFREMLSGGYTTVGEFHYLHHLPDGARGTQMAGAVKAAAADAGIRLALLPVYYARGGFGRPPDASQHRFVCDSAQAFVDMAASLGAAGIAPHSLRAVDARELPALTAAARSALGDDTVFHIHVAEQRREVEDCRAATGNTPVELLRASVDLDASWSLIHATHATPAELAGLVADDVNVVLCPLTEANLGDGIFPATGYRRDGGRFAIGSDCNARIDAVEELRLLEYGQRLSSGRRTCLADANGLSGLWAATARTGARALNVDAGAIEPGKWADLAVLAPVRPLAGLPPERALDALIAGGCSTNIDAVYVAGRRIDAAADTSPEFVTTVQRLAGAE